RVGRNLAHLVTIADDMREHGVGFYFAKDAVDTSTASGRLFFGVLASLGEFERERLRERTIAGLEEARRRGKTLGRKARDARDREKLAERARELEAEGLSQRKIAAKLGICAKTIRAVLAEHPEPAPLALAA